jgi:hypothetical protein
MRIWLTTLRKLIQHGLIARTRAIGVVKSTGVRPKH